METIRVLIADDHPLVRCGIRETLCAADDITLVGEASRGDEVQRLCQELQPDVLLLDLQMPGATAAAVSAQLYLQRFCWPLLVHYHDMACIGCGRAGWGRPWCRCISSLSGDIRIARRSSLARPRPTRPPDHFCDNSRERAICTRLTGGSRCVTGEYDACYGPYRSPSGSSQA